MKARETPKGLVFTFVVGACSTLLAITLSHVVGDALGPGRPFGALVVGGAIVAVVAVVVGIKLSRKP